jgi:hypothetical protein
MRSTEIMALYKFRVGVVSLYDGQPYHQSEHEVYARSGDDAWLKVIAELEKQFSNRAREDWNVHKLEHIRMKGDIGTPAMPDVVNGRPMLKLE